MGLSRSISHLFVGLARLQVFCKAEVPLTWTNLLPALGVREVESLRIGDVKHYVLLSTMSSSLSLVDQDYFLILRYGAWVLQGM